MSRREELEAERERLQGRLDEIAAQLRGELTRSMSRHEQVRVMLEQEPSKVWTADELGARLVADVRPDNVTVSVALSRLVREGYAERVGHGRYTTRRNRTKGSTK
jgi:predicted transcriptional regulator of viral defense system